MSRTNEIVLDLEHAGRSYYGFTAGQLAAEGVPAAAIATAVAAAEQRLAREALRARIQAEAGDIPSLLGTTADTAALAILTAYRLLAILSEHGSAAVKAQIEASMPVPAPQASALLDAIAAGVVRVPALEKGLSAVHAEIGQRSTATAAAMTASSMTASSTTGGVDG